MRPEDLLDALYSADAALSEDEALTAALARAARARRSDEEAGLAHGEHLDGAWYDEEEARAASRDEEEVLRLAAASQGEVEPVRYAAEGWTVVLARRPDGGWSALLAGPSPARLELPAEAVLLSPRTWTAVRSHGPPALLTLRLEDGRILVLQRTG